MIGALKAKWGEKGPSVSNPQSLASHFKDQQFWGPVKVNLNNIMNPCCTG